MYDAGDTEAMQAAANLPDCDAWIARNLQNIKRKEPKPASNVGKMPGSGVTRAT